MPEGWEEFTGRELGSALDTGSGDAEEILDLTWHLEVNLVRACSPLLCRVSGYVVK